MYVSTYVNTYVYVYACARAHTHINTHTGTHTHTHLDIDGISRKEKATLLLRLLLVCLPPQLALLLRLLLWHSVAKKVLDEEGEIEGDIGT